MTAALFAALDATWPAARTWRADGWTFRDGQGGGKRVSAATWDAPGAPEDLSPLETQFASVGEAPLVRVQGDQADLDEMLAAAGYTILDPTRLWTVPISALTDKPIPPVTAFAIWEPLAIMREVWAQAGISSARLAVMARAKTKTAILSRCNDKPAGTAFAALHNDICMVHAVEVLLNQQRKGMAAWMMRKAGFWAMDQGAQSVAVACVAGNKPAEALYESLGFVEAGQYHYRIKPGTP